MKGALCLLALLTPTRASATCAEPDGCGFFHSYGGAAFTRSSSRVDGQRTNTLYGISVGGSGIGLLLDRAGRPHLLDFTRRPRGRSG